MDSTLTAINEKVKAEADAKNAGSPAAPTNSQPVAPAATPQPATTGIDWEKVSNEDLQKIIAERKISLPATEVTVKTPEQIQQENEARELSVIKYGVEKLGKKKEELLKPSELKNKKDEDLVWQDFVNEQKSKNAKITDETILKRYNKAFNINQESTDEDYTPEYDDDEVAFGKEQIAARAKFIRDKAERPLLETKSAWEKEESATVKAKQIFQNVEKITTNKTYNVQIGDFSIEYTLNDEQNKALQQALGETVFTTQNLPNYSGQEIDYAAQAMYIAKEQNQSDIVKQIVDREVNAAVAKALEPYGNPVVYNSTSTAGVKTIDQKVQDSIDQINKMQKGKA